MTTLPKITKDGTVTLEGTILGTVTKEMTEGLGFNGFRIQANRTAWIPVAVDGTRLSEYGTDTRKRAVGLLIAYSRPLTVSDVKIETPLSLTGGGTVITACVSWQGNWASVSRYEVESCWVVDAFAPLGAIMPHWSNGTGSRCTVAHALRDEQAQAVTDAAIAAGYLNADGSWAVGDGTEYRSA